MPERGPPATTTGGLTAWAVNCLGGVGFTVCATCIGGVCYVSAKYFSRVFIARRRLQQLLAPVAGEDSRVVITGATSGIGQELARQLLRHPSVSLLLGCRDVRRAERLFRYAGASVDAEKKEGERFCRIVPLDLLDFDKVQAFTDEVHTFLREGGDGIRMLVNNAGVMRPPARKTGAIDSTWQTNFLSGFLITELLARLRSSPIFRSRADSLAPVRIVQVSSRLESHSQLDENMIEQIDKGLCGEHAYADSKRAMMLWTSVRAQGLFKSGLFVHAATPGMVDTQLGRYSINPWLWPLTKPLRLLLLRSPAEGALGVAAAGLRKEALTCFGRYMDGEKQLEDLMMERMGEKRFALQVTKWATEKTALEQRAEGYEK